MKTIPHKLNYSAFAPLKGTTFNLTDVQGNIEKLTLSQLSKFPTHYSPSGNPDRYPFSLIFHVQSCEVSIPQGIYTLSNPDIGEHLLFFVPIQPDDQGNRLEVHIN